MKIRRCPPWLAVLLGFLAGNVAMWWYLHRDQTAAAVQLVADAQRALRTADYSQAERLARQALTYSGDSTAAMLIAGEAAAKSNRLDEAVAYYSLVPDTGNEVTFKALAAKADALFHLGRLAESEAAFRRALELDPQNELVTNRYAALLDTVGRRWGSRPYLLNLIKIGRFTLQELCLLANYHDPLEVGPVLEKALKAVPGDFDPLLARARIKLKEGETPLVTELLWKVVHGTPANLEAQGLLGTVLADSGADRDFQDWREQLPESASGDPGVWFAQGLWCKQEGRLEEAVRCYWEALRLEIDHQGANYQLALVLKLLRRPDWAERFDRRAQLLAQINIDTHIVYTEGPTSEKIPNIAEKMEALGRYWEAWAWNVARAKQGDEEAAGARDRLKKILDRENPPQTMNKFNPALQIDLSRFPRPEWSDRGAARREISNRSAVPEVQAAFVDSTQSCGIDFSYFNGDDLETPGMKIHQTLGGGIAVIDYDGDGWPDIHFTQGAREVLDYEDPDHPDRLYRNLGNGRFADVTFSAGAADYRYSQGATTGDYDNDGFPDLFISNIGRSHLYRNNGDGTFTDVTGPAGIDLNHWSTCSLLADLNGDGLPDIYDVTYVRGEDVYHKICGKDLARACTPLNFEGEADHLLLNLGDGRFRDVSSEAGLGGILGKGLGVLAADFDRSGRLSLVVANDTEMNFYLVNLTPSRGAAPFFEDRAVAKGLAYDRDGMTQANMGIAADDCNGDGLLDLYITTFYKESKTLRVQQADQLFIDVTREANLRDASYDNTGFGTQFLDGELDGLPDLVVANGHVDDYTHAGRPFEMQPQYFRNVGNGRFVERPATTLGPYFEARHLGRCLVRLDWNRDGREDFAVGHLNARSALITNDTRGAGHYLAVRLVAVNSARDAIGAVATLTAGDLTRVRELTGGDGYFGTNQRQLVFGLERRRRVDKLVIQWPSGAQQEFVDLAVDREYLLIENRVSPVSLGVDR